MIFLYYSKDRGLLDYQAYLFKKKYAGVKHMISPKFSSLELVLLQRSLGDPVENLIIEGYTGSLDVLNTLIRFSGIENLLILQYSKPKGEILNSIDNEEFEINKLNENTKRGYLNSLLKEKYFNLKLSKSMVDTIKGAIPPSALVINDLMENVMTLKAAELLDEVSLLSLLGTVKKEPNYFNFLKLYLCVDLNGWVRFLNDHVCCSESLNSFFYSLSYQLLELKRYLSVRFLSKNFLKVEGIMGVERHMLNVYKEFYSRWGDSLLVWLDEFIIELYTFHFSVIYSVSVNIALLKSFLLRKWEDLRSSSNLTSIC